MLTPSEYNHAIAIAESKPLESRAIAFLGFESMNTDYHKVV